MMLQTNMIMCRDAAVLLSPLHQHYIRSAGRVGYNSIEELVDAHLIPIYLRVAPNDLFGEEDGTTIAMNIPVFPKTCERIPPDAVACHSHSAVPQEAMPRRLGYVVWPRAEYQWSTPAHSTRFGIGIQQFYIIITDLTIVGLGGITTIADWFMMEWPSLEKVTLEGLGNHLTHIGSRFLDSCKRLSSVNMVDTRLPPSCEFNHMLSFNSSMTTVRIGCEEGVDLANVTILGHSFMIGCESMISISLHSLHNITHIGPDFLSACTHLNTIDLSGLVSIISIGDVFMKDRLRLQTITMPPSLGNLKAIHNGFMKGCIRLVRIELSDLKSLEQIGDGFMLKCAGMNECRLTGGGDKMKSMGQRFLKGCTSLSNIDLTSFNHVFSVGQGFMTECTNMGPDVDLSPLNNAETIGERFMWKWPHRSRYKYNNKEGGKLSEVLHGAL